MSDTNTDTNTNTSTDTNTDYGVLAARLRELLKLERPPVAISFHAEAPAGVPLFDAPMSEPTMDGRRGRVAAGCVFWVRAEQSTFATLPEDHGNCSVGSVTHGLLPLSEAATRADVGALVESGWVTPEMFPHIPVLAHRPGCIVYGPLADAPVAPDVVFLRLSAKQAMVVSDALPGLRFEGKPQCHIIPIAHEDQQVAVSVGCMLSRVRTGLGNGELTCAIPAAALPDLLSRLASTCAADARVAAYAAEDSRRFNSA